MSLISGFFSGPFLDPAFGVRASSCATDPSTSAFVHRKRERHARKIAATIKALAECPRTSGRRVRSYVLGSLVPYRGRNPACWELLDKMQRKERKKVVGENFRGISTSTFIIVSKLLQSLIVIISLAVQPGESVCGRSDSRSDSCPDLGECDDGTYILTWLSKRVLMSSVFPSCDGGYNSNRARSQMEGPSIPLVVALRRDDWWGGVYRRGRIGEERIFHGAQFLPLITAALEATGHAFLRGRYQWDTIRPA